MFTCYQCKVMTDEWACPSCASVDRAKIASLESDLAASRARVAEVERMLSIGGFQEVLGKLQEAEARELALASQVAALTAERDALLALARRSFGAQGMRIVESWFCMCPPNGDEARCLYCEARKLLTNGGDRG